MFEIMVLSEKVQNPVKFHSMIGLEKMWFCWVKVRINVEHIVQKSLVGQKRDEKNVRKFICSVSRTHSYSANMSSSEGQKVF